VFLLYVEVVVFYTVLDPVHHYFFVLMLCTTPELCAMITGSCC